MALLAQDPGDGVHNIGFAAAVGPDNARQAASAEGDLRLLAERFEAYQLHFAQFEQDIPFMASAVVRWAAQKRRYLGRDVYRFLGRVGTATKSLKGRLTVAQPPGATMAVTGKHVNMRRAKSKEKGAKN